MDSDIQFGDLTEAQPEKRLRPDQDRHYAVVPCGKPALNELPIFVDIDTMLDIERHALSDTSVELGGVMLGGQYEDDEGRPFVVIEDSLRAEHYQATKGSFKFTHETWEQITRQRDEFSPELEMVGWYHTHPDWGVFLSGMDLFICDNFFNRSLDVALVVDPCRDDRGWFQWIESANGKETKRTKGFYLIGSRFRQEEIEQFSHILQGTGPMAVDPRQRPIAGYVGSSQPIIQFADRGQNTTQMIMLGMMSLQFVFVAIVAIVLLLPVFRNPDKSEVEDNQALIMRKLNAIEAESNAGLDAEAQRQVLNALSQQLAGVPDGMSTEFEEVVRENIRLETSLDATVRQSKELDDVLEETRIALRKSRTNEERLKTGLALQKVKLEDADAQAKELEAMIEGKNLPKEFYKDWRAWMSGIFLAAVAGFAGYFMGRSYFESDDADSDGLLARDPKFKEPEFSIDMEDQPNDTDSDARDGHA